MLSQRLKQLRLDNRLTQSEMAKILGTSQPSYQNWEKGVRTPTAKNLEKIAKFFNTSVDYLLGKTDIKNSSELSDTDITEFLNNGTVSYDGKPMTDHDKEVLTQVIKDYFNGKLEDYD